MFDLGNYLYNKTTRITNRLSSLASYYSSNLYPTPDNSAFTNYSPYNRTYFSSVEEKYDSTPIEYKEDFRLRSLVVNPKTTTLSLIRGNLDGIQSNPKILASFSGPIAEEGKHHKIMGDIWTKETNQLEMSPNRAASLERAYVAFTNEGTVKFGYGGFKEDYKGKYTVFVGGLHSLYNDEVPTPTDHEGLSRLNVKEGSKDVLNYEGNPIFSPYQIAVISSDSYKKRKQADKLIQDEKDKKETKRQNKINYLKQESSHLKEEADRSSREAERLEDVVDLFKNTLTIGIGGLTTLALYDSVIKPQVKDFINNTFKKKGSMDIPSSTEGIKPLTISPEISLPLKLQEPKSISLQKAFLSRTSFSFSQLLLSPGREVIPTVDVELLSSSYDVKPSFNSTLQERVKPHIAPYYDGMSEILNHVRERYSFGLSINSISNQKLLPPAKAIVPQFLGLNSLHQNIQLSTKSQVVPYYGEIEEIRKDYETRFRQSYVNEANRKGFDTVNVEVISSTYESKPFINSHFDLDSPLTKPPIESKAKTRMERKFETYDVQNVVRPTNVFLDIPSSPPISPQLSLPRSILRNQVVNTNVRLPDLSSAIELSEAAETTTNIVKKKAGMMGGIGKIALGFAATGVALRGFDYISYTASNVLDFFTFLTTESPYENIILPGGHRVIPEFTKGPVLGTSKAKTYVEGYRVKDISTFSAAREEYKTTKDSLLNTSIGLIMATSGGIGALALDIAMVKTSRNIANKSAAFKHIFDRDMTGDFSKNFSPLVIGAVTGLLSTEGDIGDKAQGAYLGAMAGSFVGFMMMKEEIGPTLNRRLGLGLMGAGAALMVTSNLLKRRKDLIPTAYGYNEDGSVRVTYDNLDELIMEGRGRLPHDIYAHPDAINLARSYLESNIKRTNIYSVEASANYKDIPLIYDLDKTDGYKTRLGKLNIDLDISVPSYSKQEGYKRVSQQEIKSRYSIDKDKESPLDRVAGMFNAYQIGLFIPSITLFGIGALAEAKKLDKVSKVVNLLTSYKDKLDFIWPGEKQIGEGITNTFGAFPSYIKTGRVSSIGKGLGDIAEGMKKKVVGEAFSLARKAFIYTVPLTMVSMIFEDIAINRRSKVNVYDQELSHFDKIEVLMPQKTGIESLDKLIETQRYMEEGAVYKINENTIIYDAGTIGKGLRNFLEVSPDKSVKGLLYKLGHEEGLLEIMSRKAAYGGIGISGGENINTAGFWEDIGDIFIEQGSWANTLSYPARVAKAEGFMAGVNSLTSPIIGGVTNFIATNLGFDPIYRYKFDGELDEYDLLAQSANALAFGVMGSGLGFSAQVLLNKQNHIQRRFNRYKGLGVGMVLGGIIGASLPTHIDSGFYKSFSKQLELSTGVFKEEAAYRALTDKSSPQEDMIISALAYGLTPAAIGAVLPGSISKKLMRGGLLGLAGYGLGTAASYALTGEIAPISSMIRRNMRTKGYDLSNQTFGVLEGSKRIPGEVRLTHIHSKVLWNEEEVFISTGNLDTVWKTIYGNDSQLNVAVRIKGEQADNLVKQLNKLHAFLKEVKPEDELSLIAAETPDLVLGGRGSGSDKKILDFIQSTEGDLWISAPYLSGVSKEVRPLVEAIKTLEAKGQNVHLVAQNPRGVAAGGMPELSIALQKELMLAGVDIYTAPYTDESLAHAKFLADAKKVLITSHNLFSGNSINQVVEVGIILRGKEYADAVKQAALQFMIKNDYSLLSDKPEFSPEVFFANNIVERINDLGIDKRLAPLFLDSKESGSLLLRPQMGASFFYSRALYNNLMRQAGYGYRTLDYKDTGIATSVYKQAYLAAINKDSIEKRYQDIDTIPFFISQFDKELLTPGLGGLFNEFIAMPLGLGRLYKDEVGFLPSLAGTIGAVLDKTYLYTTGKPISGVTIREDTLGISDQRYKDKSGSVGLFETVFTEGVFLAQQAASSVAFYMIIGEPLNLLIAEAVKTQMEDIINLALDPDLKTSRKTSMSRVFSLGFSGASQASPITRRLDVINLVDTYKKFGGFFSPYNMDLSSYHLTNLFIRERAGRLQDEVMKPFILDYINPYTRTDKKSQEGFRTLMFDVVEEFRRPIDLQYEFISGQSSNYKTITSSRRTLQSSFKSLNTRDLSGEIIGYKGFRADVIDIVNSISGTRLGESSSLEEITESLGDIVKGRNEDNKQRLKREIDKIDLNNKELYNEYTSEGDLIKNIKFSITNVGQDRASMIAQKVQSILDEVPLNPLRWGVFNKYKVVGLLLGEWKPGEKYEGGYQRRDIDGIVYSKGKTIGDILSFSELTEITRDLLFGKGGISSFVARYEVHRPSNQAQTTARRIALNATDKIHSVWNTTIGFIGEASKRIWDRYFLLVGTPFHKNGLLRSTNALKAMEYNLVNTQGMIEGTKGISWSDDTSLVKTKVKVLNEEGLELWNKLYTLVDTGNEVEAVRLLQNTGEGSDILESFLLRGNRKDFIDYYASIFLPKDINPLARQINTIDSSVVFAMQQIQAVDTTIKQTIDPNTGARTLGQRIHISVQEHLRSEMISRFGLANLSGKQLTKRLIKIGANEPGFKPGGGRKNVMLTNIAWTLVTSTLFLESLFKNTSGVSLTTQLGLALTTGGGILSPLLGNKEGELNMSTEFAATQLLPGSGSTRYVLGIALSALTLGLSHMIGTASIRETVLEYSIQPALFKRMLGKEGVDKAFVDVSLKYKVNGSSNEIKEILLSNLIRNEWKDLNHVEILNRIKGSTLTIGDESLRLSSRSYVFGLAGKRLASIQATVESGQLVSKALTFRGNIWRNTAIAYSVLSLGSRAAVGTIANTLNFLRDNTGSIDPLVFAGLGAVLGGKVGGTFGGAIMGATLGAGLLTFMNKALDKRIFDIGRKGILVHNTQGQIVTELSDFRNRVIGNLDRTSRAEMMAALWAGKIMGTAALLESTVEPSQVKVQAKQIVLPFLQFYFVSRTTGERKDRLGDIIDPGQTSFSIGIQGPPMTGMSVGVSLPVKIIKGKGVFGLTANNDEYDIADLIKDVAGVVAGTQLIATSIGLLDKGVTASGRVFNKVLGATANPVNQIPRRTALGVMSRGLSDIAQMTEDLGLILPNTFLRVGSSVSTVEYRLLRDIYPSNKMTPPSIDKPEGIRSLSYLPSITKLMVGSFVGATIGQFAFSILGPLTKDDYDLDAASDMGIMTGAIGTPILQIGALNYHRFTHKVSNLPLTSYLKGNIERTLPKVRNSPIPRSIRKLNPIGRGKIYTGAFALGYFLSSSNSGVSIGMDDDKLNQVGIAAAYSAVMGTIATSANMGMGMSSTLQTYNKLTQDIAELSSLKGSDSSVLKRIRLEYQKLRVKSIRQDAEDVITVFINNKNEIEARYSLYQGTAKEAKYKKLKDISDSLDNLDLGSAQEMLNSRTVKGFNTEDIKGSFLEGRFKNRVFARRILRTLKVPIFAAMVGGVLNAFNPDINADNFLNFLEGRSHYQERYRSKLVGGNKTLEQRIRDVAADTFKLLFFKDRDVDSRVMLDKIVRSGSEYEGFNHQVQYSKLLSTNKDVINDIGTIYNEVSQLFVLDDANSFITFGIAGGAFRKKEYGTVMTPYVQIQSSGADVSAAAYTMTSSFLFKSMMYGPNDLLFNVQNAMRFLNSQTIQGKGNDSRVLRLTALRMLSGTAHMNPRTKARRVSTISSGVLSAITKDSLLSSILDHRVKMTRNLSFQPYESLVSILLKGQLNPSNPNLDRMMSNKLKGIDKGIDELFVNDPFFLIAKNFNITNILIFGKGKGDKVESKSMGSGMESDDVWAGMDSYYTSSYLPEEKSMFKDNPLIQLTGRLFDSLPGPVGFIGQVSLAALMGFSVISKLHSLSVMGESRVLTKELGDYFNKDWFGQLPHKKGFYVWNIKYRYPMVGERVYLANSPPVLYKGSYQFQLNRSFFSKSSRQAFNEIQEDLNNLLLKGWGAVESKEGTHVLDFLINQKEKHIRETLQTFNSLPQSFQDIQEGNNRFSYDRTKSVEHNLQSINNLINQDDIDFSFKQRLNEERVKLSGQVDSLTGSKGKELLISKITDNYSRDIDTFIDNYISTIANKKITITAEYLNTMGITNIPIGESAEVRVSAITLFAPNADLEQMIAITNDLDEDIDRGLKSLVNVFDDDHKKAFMIGDNADIKTALKAKARSQIDKALKDYLGKLDKPEDIIKFLSKIINGDALEITNMSTEVLGHLTGIKGDKQDSFFGRMRHHWGGLGKSPGHDHVRVLDKTLGTLSRWLTTNGAPENEDINPSKSSYTSHPYLIRHNQRKIEPNEILRLVDDDTYIDRIAKAQAMLGERESITAKTLKTGGLLWEVYGLANDILEALNVFSAFSNLADSYRNRNMSEAQRLNYAYDAGMVTVNLGFSVGIMSVGVHLGMLGVSTLLTGAAGLIAGTGIGLGVLGIGFLGYNLLPEKQKQQFKSAINNSYESTGLALKKAGDFAFDMGNSLGGQKLGSIFSAGTIGGIGGAIAGATTGVALGTFSLISAAVLGTSLISLPALGMMLGVGAGIGIILGGTLSAVGGGKIIDGWMDKLSKIKIGKNEIFRPFINRPGDWLRMKNISNPITGTSKYGSPIEVLTVNEAIQRDYSSMLYAAKDETGRSSAGLFISPNIYGGNIGESNPHMSKYGNISIIRPSGVADPLLIKDISLRGQAFNQTIIGRYTWRKILSKASNLRDIKRASELFDRQEYKAVQKSIEQAKEIKNNIGDLKADTPGKGNISQDGARIVSNILGIRDKYIQNKMSKNKTQLPLRVKVDMSNVNDREREYTKDLKFAVKEVTLINRDNIVRVVPTLDAEIKENIFNPVSGTIVA